MNEQWWAAWLKEWQLIGEMHYMCESMSRSIMEAMLK